MSRRLDLRFSSTARVPERQDLHLVAMDSVIKIVVNSSKVDAPDSFGPDVQRWSADGGLRAEQRNASFSSSSKAWGALGRFFFHQVAAWLMCASARLVIRTRMA